MFDVAVVSKGLGCRLSSASGYAEIAGQCLVPGFGLTRSTKSADSFG